MIEWYKKVVFENYVNFNGRARRSEYWYYTLVTVIISIILTIIDKTTGLTFGIAESGIISSVYSLLVFLPGLSVLVRRLHDVGKSGWFFFIVFIPIAGIIWLLVLLCKEGNQGALEVPLTVAQEAYKVYEFVKIAAKLGNKNAISDAGVSALMLQASIESAILNVKINLCSVKDEAYKEELKSICEELIKEGRLRRDEILDVVNESM